MHVYTFHEMFPLWKPCPWWGHLGEKSLFSVSGKANQPCDEGEGEGLLVVSSGGRGEKIREKMARKRGGLVSHRLPGVQDRAKSRDEKN